MWIKCRDRCISRILISLPRRLISAIHLLWNNASGSVEAILSKHYINDNLYSVDTIEEAVKIINNTIMIYGKEGFEMRGWISNLWTALPLNCVPKIKWMILICPIGLKWCPIKDILKCCSDFNKIKKRKKYQQKENF